MLEFPTTMILFLGAIIASVLINRKSLSNLTAEQKIAVIESTPKVPWTLIFIAAAYGIYSLLASRFDYSAIFLGGFMVVLVCGLLVSFTLTTRQLRKLSLPPSYIRTYVIGQVVVIFALLGLFWGLYGTNRDIDINRIERKANKASISTPDPR